MINYDFERFSMRDKYSGLHSTPEIIAYDIVSLLDSTGFFDEPDENITLEEYIKTHRVIDIYCKSGSILYAFYCKFMVALQHVIPDIDARDYFINNFLIYGLSPDKDYLNALRDTFYCNKKYDLSEDLGNFYHYNFSNGTGEDKLEVEELLKSMDFDVVVGNPPYNDGAYLDFVLKGHIIAKSYDLWITPINFVTKSIGKSEITKKNKVAFNDTIIPYITNFVYYPDEVDCFLIKQPGGVAYYLVGKNKVDSCRIVNKCSRVKGKFDSDCNRSLSDLMLLNIGHSIISKFGNYKRLHLSTLDCSKRYILASSDMTSYCNSVNVKYGLFSSVGDVTVTPIQEVLDSTISRHSSSVAKVIYSSDNIDEINSFHSYIDSKFIRFLVLCGLGSSSVYNDDVWRFVPSQDNYDCIFEDKCLTDFKPDENGEYLDSDGKKHCSLYVKYKLTDEEISIIESVIRERK